MKLIYGIHDKPKFPQLLIFAFQQLLAIMAATIAVPNIVGNGLTPSAALFGAGVGTLIYLLFTKFRSPVFLGSSFAFIGSMFAAFAGGVSMQLGFAGIIIGALFAALVYVIIAVIVKFAGVNWINKLMPAVVIGPTVAIIGLSLAGNAIGDLQKSNVSEDPASTYVAIVCGLITLLVTIISSCYSKKFGKLIPFIYGILSGYAAASIFALIGNLADIPALIVIDYTPIVSIFEEINVSTFIAIPKFTFIEAFKGLKEITPSYIASIAAAYVPVAFVVFAEHIADHKNLSTIVDKDLLEDPGLHRTLLGDGVGSLFGALFGGCPNTTYGESVGCVAITRNASIATIFTTSILAILISFVSPFVAFLSTIPSCVMGGVCVALYGFIAVSGLKMLQGVDLNQNKNLFVVSVILISGIGGFALTFGSITITSIATSIILGIIVNLICKNAKED